MDVNQDTDTYNKFEIQEDLTSEITMILFNEW
jgi:hypothetical protein